MNESKNEVTRYEIVERYCPKCGDNVIMRRTFGKTPTFKCMNYEKCRENKDKFCEDSLIL